MRSKVDTAGRRGRRGKRKPLPGGKALQRLFTYFDQRDPHLNEALVASIPTKKAARPRFALTAKAMRAPEMPAQLRRPARRARRAAPAARAFATAIANAATALDKTRPRAKPVRRPRAVARHPTALAAPAPAPSATAVWKSIGPSLIPNGQTYGSNRVDVIGRVSCIAVDPSKSKHVLCSGACGGIWESFDAGATWAPRTDQMPSLAIGAIAFDPKNPKVVYAGSGEGNFYQNLGAGVYRSTDGGMTWKVIARAPFVGIGFYDLVVDPSNPKVLYAATVNGFYVSHNRGVNWSLRRNVRCWDISLHPHGGPSAEILAAFADGLFVSTSGGASFSAVALPASPAGRWSRLAVDRVAAAPDIAYVFGASGTSAYLWRRTGTTWTRITPPPALRINQAWYDWYVAAAPNNKGLVYLGAINTWRGTFAGSSWTWKNITAQGNHSIHPDQHCLTFDPKNANVIYAGNDGGIYRSRNRGASWTALNKGLGITEIEYMAGDPATWKWLMAGTQDNGTLRFTGSHVWEHIADGDGGDCGVNQCDPDEVFHSFYYVTLQRSRNRGNTWTTLHPPNMTGLFYPPVEVFGSTVAIGGVKLDISRNNGTSWTAVNLALPGNDIVSAMDLADKDTVYMGTRFGRVLRARWTGSGWSKTMLTSPTNRYISCIKVDPGYPKRLWVTISQVGGGTVYRSDNGGSSWVNCFAGLPRIPKNSVAIDTADSKHVWVAADVGVYESKDLGAHWSGFSNGLPNAIAADLLFHRADRILICATRNRGAWAVAVP